MSLNPFTWFRRPPLYRVELNRSAAGFWHRTVRVSNGQTVSTGEVVQNAADMREAAGNMAESARWPIKDFTS